MTRRPPLLAVTALLVGGLTLSATAGEEHPGAAEKPAGSTPASWDDAPHGRAPHNVLLEITEDALVRAPNADWFYEALDEQEPGRFEQVDELVDVEGDLEPGWRDAKGEYVAIYDADEDEIAYWQRIPAEELTRGRQDFVQFCASCHGFEGDGYGRSAQWLRPPPRDFRQGLFKFAKTPDGKLPLDDDLVALVKRGLDGTPMYPWALGDEQLHGIVKYIKTLSLEEKGWADVYSEFGTKVDIGADPWADPTDEARNKELDAKGIERGRVVYHTMGCYNCHPGYATPSEIDAILEGEGKAALGSYRDNLTVSRVDAASSYQVQGYNVKILPPDFTFETIRVGRTPQEVAETVAAGIPGANMPTWKNSIPDGDIWAIGHYIRHLVDAYKDQPTERQAFFARLRQDG
jgi:mono/diheme cytochrome c family protein